MGLERANFGLGWIGPYFGVIVVGQYLVRGLGRIPFWANSGWAGLILGLGRTHSGVLAVVLMVVGVMDCCTHFHFVVVYG